MSILRSEDRKVMNKVDVLLPRAMEFVKASEIRTVRLITLLATRSRCLIKVSSACEVMRGFA
jgi:hypothetical protein